MIKIELQKEEGLVGDLLVSVSAKDAELLLDIIEDWVRLVKRDQVNNFSGKRGFVSLILDPTGMGKLAP